jgi:hypothetical protein
MSNSQPSYAAAKVDREWRDAAAQIQVGATYAHNDGGADVIVTGFNDETGQVSWQKPDGPGPLDGHRVLFALDFLTAYSRKPAPEGYGGTMTAHAPATLRKIVPAAGRSDIADTDERDSLTRAVQTGHIHRETHTGLVDGKIIDFARVVEYDVPGTETTRFALWRDQGDLFFILDSADRAAVDTAYEDEVRGLADCDPDGWWALTDVDDVPLRVDEDEDSR